MSASLISIHDSRLARHYFEAERRKLELRIVEENTVEVSSHSRRGLWHRVELIGDEARCYCEATEVCSHLALALSYFFPVTCFFKWDCEESAKFIDLRHRIKTNGTLTRSEKRRITRAIREREEVAA